jgi:uracil-DNA glycosylase
MYKMAQPKSTWLEAIKEYEIKSGKRLNSFLDSLEEAGIAYCPARDNVLKCFSYFEVSETKLVILGQDPYHTPGQATGLAFQCSSERSQPSLKNIEVVLGHKVDFDDWAKKGVLLLNTALTVEVGKPESHLKQWRSFTDYMIEFIDRSVPGVLFVCWGAKARDLCKTVRNKVVCSHPSPLSASKPCGVYPSFMDSGIFKSIEERCGIVL